MLLHLLVRGQPWRESVASGGPVLDRAGETSGAQRHLVDLYEEVGVLRSAAERFVTFLVASRRGRRRLARAQQDIEPFEVVADQLIQQAKAMPRKVSTALGHRGISDWHASEASTGKLLAE